MALTKVKFHGVSSIHSPDKDLSVTMELSNEFETKIDDLVIILPVGWKNLSQGRIQLQPKGRVTLTFSLACLSAEAADSTFQVVYVQDQVVFGASSPFSLGIPYDDESLSYHSLDSNTLVIKTFEGRDPDVILTSKHHGCLGNDALRTQREKGEAKLASKLDQELPNGQEYNTVGLFERLGSEVSASTDDESFVVAEMPPSHPRGEENYYQVMVTHLLQEKDELSKLFRQERGIALQQEKKYEDLRYAHDVLARENKELQGKLNQMEFEVEAMIRKSSIAQQTSSRKECRIREKGISHLEMSNEGVSDKSHGNHAEHLFSDRVKGSFPHTPPLTSPVQSLGYGTDERAESSGTGVAGGLNSVSSLPESVHCPMCSMTFNLADSTAFQRHVHSHFGHNE